MVKSLDISGEGLEDVVLGVVEMEAGILACMGSVE